VFHVIEISSNFWWTISTCSPLEVQQDQAIGEPDILVEVPQQQSPRQPPSFQHGQSPTMCGGDY
jgi:hypothetical protein